MTDEPRPCYFCLGRLEDSLPGNIANYDHREILSLLCKCHELEIENTESQSAMLLKDHEMRKKDMIIERFDIQASFGVCHKLSLWQYLGRLYILSIYDTPDSRFIASPSSGNYAVLDGECWS